MRAATGRSASRLRGTRTFWALLALAAIVTISGPVVLGVDDKLPVPRTSASLLPAKPSVKWPNLIVNGPAGSSTKRVGPPAPNVALLTSLAIPAVVTGPSRVSTAPGKSRAARPAAVARPGGPNTPNVNPGPKVKPSRPAHAGPKAKGPKPKAAPKANPARKPRTVHIAAVSPKAKPKPPRVAVAVAVTQPTPAPAKQSPTPKANDSKPPKQSTKNDKSAHDG